MGGWGCRQESQGMEDREYSLTEDYQLSVGSKRIPIDLNWSDVLLEFVSKCVLDIQHNCFGISSKVASSGMTFVAQ